jgi:anti-anti-sigma factor
MKIDINRDENVTHIKLIGKYDIEELLFFSTVFSDEINKKPSAIALNLESLTYIDSSGIGTLIRYMNMASKEKIDFFCYNLSKNIENIFRISKLDQFLCVLSPEDLQEKFKALCSANN